MLRRALTGCDAFASFVSLCAALFCSAEYVTPRSTWFIYRSSCHQRKRGTARVHKKEGLIDASRHTVEHEALGLGLFSGAAPGGVEAVAYRRGARRSRRHR